MKPHVFALTAPLAFATASLLPVGIALATLAGCGGAKSPKATAQPVDNGVAKATIAIEWPVRDTTRLVPVASNSVRITITSATGFLASMVVARPATVGTFTNLPPGLLTVTVTAHPDSSGNGLPAQATGTQEVVAVAEETFTLPITLNSTVNHLVITPAAQTALVVGGNTATASVAAVDSAGRVVLTGGSTFTWRTASSGVVNAVDSGASVVLTGVAPGTATVVVTETESGKTAPLAVTVTSTPIALPSPAESPAVMPTPTADPFAGVKEYTSLNPDAVANYANPVYPVHYDAAVLGQDNTPAGNTVTNRGATLGRVLFYDKRLSINNTISCASCHQQSNGFSDNRQLSTGFNGASFTGAHAMRLANIRFYTGNAMFWDKRAASVEAQVTRPLQDSVEMGFDAANGGMAALLTKMGTLRYYPELFRWAFGDDAITQDRLERALAQYERSIVSVNSKFDAEYAGVYNPTNPRQSLNTPFPGFTAAENRGKTLFLTGPNQGGAGCNTCHQAPTFALDANSRSNGLDANETRIFKSPSLKNSAVGGPFMHDGRFATLDAVVTHYDNGIRNGPALDNRLKGPGNVPQRLNLSATEKSDLVAFLRTLTDTAVTSDPKFADPFLK